MFIRNQCLIGNANSEEETSAALVCHCNSYNCFVQNGFMETFSKTNNIIISNIQTFCKLQ